MISSIFKYFFKTKPSAEQYLDRMFQEFSENPVIAKAMDDAKSEYDQICIIKEKLADVSAWSDRAPGIMDQLGYVNMNDLDQYSMAHFYHDIGSIVFWSHISIKKESPRFDIFDSEEIESTVEGVMDLVAEKTDNFKSIDSQCMRDLVEIARQLAKGQDA